MKLKYTTYKSFGMSGYRVRLEDSKSALYSWIPAFKRLAWREPVSLQYTNM